jgi:hypothetical protein
LVSVRRIGVSTGDGKVPLSLVEDPLKLGRLRERSLKVIAALLYGYLAGWVLTTIGMALTVRRRRPVPHPIPLAIAAGAAWPVLLLGAAQLGIVALVAAALRRRRSAAVEQPLPVESVEEKV